MRKALLLFCMCLTIASSELMAQGRTVTGSVTSLEDGSALPGVNVVVKGTATGTVTDASGTYRLGYLNWMAPWYFLLSVWSPRRC